MDLLSAVLQFLWHHGWRSALRMSVGVGLGLLLGAVLVLLLDRLFRRLNWIPRQPSLGPWIRAGLLVLWCASLPVGMALAGGTLGAALSTSATVADLELGVRASELAVDGFAEALRAGTGEEERQAGAALDLLTGDRSLPAPEVEAVLTALPAQLAAAASRQADDLLADSEPTAPVVVARALVRRFASWWIDSRSEDRRQWLRAVIDEIARQEAAGDGLVDRRELAAAIARVHIEPRLQRSLFWFFLSQELVLLGAIVAVAGVFPALLCLLLRRARVESGAG